MCLFMCPRNISFAYEIAYAKRYRVRYNFEIANILHEVRTYDENYKLHYLLIRAVAVDRARAFI